MAVEGGRKSSRFWEIEKGSSENSLKQKALNFDEKSV